MSVSSSKCQDLLARIQKAEQALDDYLTGERVLNVQDGSNNLGYSAGSGIERGLRKRLAELKAQYKRGNCPVVLGHDDVDLTLTTPKGLRPLF